MSGPITRSAGRLIRNPSAGLQLHSRTSIFNRTFSSSSPNMVKILAVLYKGGKAAEEEPRLLGTLENRLGIADWLQKEGHEFVVTDDKEGPDSVFQKELPDTEILITTPFHPGYLTADLIEKAKKLKLCVTAGVGSDHVDLDAANKKNITVAEVSGSNVVSVAEHVVMSILLLVRNFVPAHDQIVNDDWNVAEIARDAYDLEGKVVGTVGCGRIGYRVLQRLQGFGCKELLWFDYTDLPEEAKKGINARRVDKLEDMLAQCDVVTINCPLHEKTRGLFNDEIIGKMKPGAWLVNTARGAIADRHAVKKALESGQLRGYAGGKSPYVQPAPKDHPWRHAFNKLGAGNGMVPHYSGTTLDAQKRYAEGAADIIKRYLAGEEQNPANLIVVNGDVSP
ncbi:formate dehydrogenase [Kwoniella heveanensis BCC8398]|uniref:Formate dehydrogenase n=1 Tax=Kwoniella heveanensis BCC8398 TaxID=1296120 RepID=A0A1B9GNT9_9TREE|nr:formate dehydrogenase [Kwoniella heveanensis BCC8398]